MEQDSKFLGGSLDVDCPFTNIPLEEAIDICANTLFESTGKAGLSKKEFKELLSLATKESYFIFSGKLYTQVDGVAMGSPLGPALANYFFVHLNKKYKKVYTNRIAGWKDQ